MAGLAAFAVKDRLTFGAVAIGLNFINIVFLSPSLWVTHALVASGGGTGPGYFIVVAQVIAGTVLFVMNDRTKTKAKISQSTG